MGSQGIYWTEKLGLAVKQSNEEVELVVERSKQQNIILFRGMIHLPRPECISSGWPELPEFSTCLTPQELILVALLELILVDFTFGICMCK